MQLADRSICTGCGACAKTCPNQAIEFVNDEEGFPTPVIVADRCVDCGRCNAVCPAIHMPERYPIVASYAAQNKEKDILMDSTSGGVFSLFAKAVLKDGGVVYGCVWDEKYQAVIRGAETKEMLAPMRGSKYVWSWAADSYTEIRDYLKEGRAVLFSGLPCQVAGLRNYLGRDYDNLWTIDYMCSGAPSPLVFHKYLDTICTVDEYPLLNLKFRDKNPYGVGVHITYRGKKSKRKTEYITNPYYYAFYSHLIDRRSCYTCPYGVQSRVSDISAGDYWGVANYHHEINLRDGVSALMINTDKGKTLLNRVREELELIPTETDSIAAENSLRCDDKRRARRIPKKRERFFRLIVSDGFKKAEKACLHDRTRLMRRIKQSLPKGVVSVLKKVRGSKDKEV